MASGGRPNALFVQAAVENLPPEMNGVADEIHIHFPWGSLLAAVANGDARVLGNLRRICVPGASLEVMIGLDLERDRTEMERLGIAPMTRDYVDTVLAARYRQAGFELLPASRLPAAWPQTTWAKRLRGGDGRRLFYIAGRLRGVR